ncbi:MAG: GNAT family N-acetyltransferase, partial [Mesorhizobium sp.]
MTVEIRRLYPGDDALVMRVADDVFDEPVRP